MSVPRHFGLGVAAGLTGAAALLLLKQRVEGRPSAPTPVHRALRFGSPSIESLRLFDGFVVAFDPRTRTPAWVLEHVTRDTAYGDGDRGNSEFKEDASFEERFRSRLADFRGSGLDRGHMAPAANHKRSQRAMDDTFLLTNICPQVGKGFNRDYWARFERFVKELTKSAEVWVATGPLFLPALTPQGFRMSHGLIGKPPRLVSVPTHFFKVLLTQQADGSFRAAAFAMPNAPIPADLPLTAFAVPLEALEAAAGLHFFPALVTAERRALLDTGALAWQAAGRQQALEQAQARALLGQPGAGLLEALPPLLLEPPPAAASGAGATLARELPLGLLEKEPLQAAADSSLAPRPQLLHADVSTAEPLDRALAASQRSSSSSSSSGGGSSSSSSGDGSSSSSGGGSGRAAVQQQQAQLAEGPTAAEAALLAAALGTPESRNAESARLGLAHLCDCVPCQLPPPDWYLAGKRGRRAEKGQPASAGAQQQQQPVSAAANGGQERQRPASPEPQQQQQQQPVSAAANGSQEGQRAASAGPGSSSSSV